MIRCLSEDNKTTEWFTDLQNRRCSSALPPNYNYFTNNANKVDQKNYSNLTTSIMKSETQNTTCPDEQTKYLDIIPNIYVSVMINDNASVMFGIPIEFMIKELHSKVAHYFEIGKRQFELIFDDEFVIPNNNVHFYELNVKPGETVESILNIHDIQVIDEMVLAKKVGTDPNPVTNKTIFVHTRNTETKIYNTTRVDMVKINYSKHFLGGFRHKTTKLEYHHAVAQTRAVAKVIPKLDMFSRDTQTHKIRNTSIDNVVTTSTQMTKTGYYVSNVTDRVVTPCGYQTADDLQSFIITKVIILQKNYRRWLAKIRVDKLRKIRDEILNYEMAEKARKANEISKRLNALFDKRRCPLYNDDFDLLYNAIEKWRLNQMAKIDPNLSTSEKKAKTCQIMDEQHEWIIAVDRLKNNAIKILNFRAKKNKLIKVSKPLVWKDKFGDIIQMDLMNTTRGKEVFEIYKSLSMDFFNREERLDILLTLKRLISNRPERICGELLGLIHREADLIMRNVGMPLLKGLRNRINTKFLILCRLTSFNPGVEKYLKVPTDPLDLRGTFQLCRYCNNYLKNSQFMFSVKSNRLGACRTCTRLYNHAMPRLELSPYRNTLYLLQKAEEEYQDNSKMAFIFSELDIKHLITKIWDSKSILSSNADLENLIFIRWSKTTEWSPWNTAFMTRDESEAHYKLDEPCSAYSDVLLNKIHQKQIAGHKYFSQLENLSDKFTVHNLKDEQAKIEAARLEEKEKFIYEKMVRFQ